MSSTSSSTSPRSTACRRTRACHSGISGRRPAWRSSRPRCSASRDWPHSGAAASKRTPRRDRGRPVPTKYVLPPEWEWPITIALFLAGVAAGTYSVMGLIHFGGDERDEPVLRRLGFIPMPIMIVVPLLLIYDLGQQSRFLNLLIKSPAATERGGPLMFNANSPMNWGSWAMVIFAAFTALAFADSLQRSGRLRLGWPMPGAPARTGPALGE